MIYKHKRTGDLYRLLLISFSVERQRESVVYMSLSTGSIFDRDGLKFNENFEFVEHSQTKIIPKEPHA